MGSGQLGISEHFHCLSAIMIQLSVVVLQSEEIAFSSLSSQPNLFMSHCRHFVRH